MQNDSVFETKNTYNKIYSDYASRNKTLHENVKQLLDIFVKLVEGKRVLDIGCASGRESKYLSDNGFEVVGIDISEKFVSVAKKECDNCKFYVQDMRKLTFKKDEFEGLWVNASFLHIPKKYALKTLRGFYKILNSKGIMLINVMEGMFDDLRLNKELGWPERHFSDYEEKEFESLLNKVGFSIIKKIPLTTSWGAKFLNYFCKKYD